MPSSPLISIVMPCYNHEKFISLAINSVLNQSYSNYELIVVNDNSTDNSLLLIEDFVKVSPKILLISNKSRQGAGAARNLGVKKSRGRYLTFLDSDDFWPPYRLLNQLNFMQEHGVRFSFGNYRKLSCSGEVIIQSVTALRSTYNYNQLIGNPAFSIITIMIDTENLGEIPAFPTNLNKAEDYIFQLELLKLGLIAHRIEENLAEYRKCHKTLYGDAAHKEMWWILRNHLKLDIFRSMLYYLRYLLAALIKRF